MTFGARQHDESLIHIMEKVFIDERSRAFAEWYTQNRHGFLLRWERGQSASSKVSVAERRCEAYLVLCRKIGSHSELDEKGVEFNRKEPGM